MEWVFVTMYIGPTFVDAQCFRMVKHLSLLTSHHLLCKQIVAEQANMERRIEQLSHTLIEGYEQEQAKMLEREELRKKRLLKEKKKRERELERMETKARHRVGVEL